ncbi:DUF3105 domain-containing protein [Deinococcus sp. Marseille-Q6407]|uniref:DUF3105 domain-containing protein n=1 Tax=Deinococcus sp. Marseille-Q6407 TaxID=2969223 RepID=UPI0021BF8AB9|nr:DUF3105 domain-containing protein [Deinococcus sp. Marseille-Q6407]
MSRPCLPVFLPLGLSLGLSLILSACGDPPQRHLAGVLRYEAPAGQHRSGSLAYDLTPPPYGDHNALWQNCGVYQAPLAPEYALHSLSHGAVWLTYRPRLDAAGTAQLAALAQGHKVLLSPEPGQTAPVVATAWNAQLPADSAGDPRLGQFISEFVDAASAPETGRSCTKGHAGTR